MIELYQAASEIQRLCDGEGWGFCFIGGLAVQRWGDGPSFEINRAQRPFTTLPPPERKS